MNKTTVVDFEKIIPKPMLIKLAQASKLNKLSMVFVVSSDAIEQLRSNKVAGLTGGEGSCIILVPQALIEEHYK